MKPISDLRLCWSSWPRWFCTWNFLILLKMCSWLTAAQDFFLSFFCLSPLFSVLPLWVHSGHFSVCKLLRYWYQQPALLWSARGVIYYQELLVTINLYSFITRSLVTTHIFCTKCLYNSFKFQIMLVFLRTIMFAVHANHKM